MPAGGEEIFESGNVVVDLKQRTVTKGGVPVSLTNSEWALLQALVSDAGNLVPFDVLLSRTWGPDYRQDWGFLRVWISRLRAKLESDLANPRVIVAEPTTGYTFVLNP